MLDIRARFLSLLFAAILSQTGWASLEDAEQLLEGGDVDGALAEVESILKHSPDDPETRFLHGIILAQKGQDDDAIVVFAALTQDYPELPEPYNNLAVLFAQKGDYEKARDALRAAIRTHPSYSTAHENLGDLYAKMASHAYDRALEENSGNESARLKLAQIGDLFSVPAMQSQAPASVAQTPAQQEPPAIEPGPTVAVAEPDPVVQPSVQEPAQTTPEAGNVETAVMAAIKGWSTAWAAQDVDGYLDHYGPNFRPRGGMARSAWENQRRDRLRRPKFIEVVVADPSIQVQGQDAVRVEFVQSYKTDTYQDQVKKILDLEKVNGLWKIRREQSAAI